MFFELDKFQARLRELNDYRMLETTPIGHFFYQPDQEGRNGTYPPKSYADQTLSIGERWRGRDAYVWLNTTVTLPPSKEDCKVVGYFDLGKTAEGNSAGFESLMFIDQKPFHGVDSNHKEVLLPPDKLGKPVRLDFRLWSGLEGGGVKVEQEHRLNAALIGYLHLPTDQFYWQMRAIYELLVLEEETNPVYYPLVQAVESALKKIDWRNPGSALFYTSMKEAYTDLSGSLKELNQTHPVKIVSVGHTHIDVAWLWQLKHTREKSARSFSTVLALMEEYPEYLFLQTQPQLYDYLKQDYPDIYANIKRKVAEGQWEVGGGMWLEADCNIPSGESLVRQFLFGYHFLKDEFNVESKYLWLPDVFGYSWALPQILKKSGIDTFMTTKISWSQYNRMPHDTFNWKGIDGTEILTHFITTPDSGDWWYYTYNGEMNPKAVKGMWENYRNKNLNQELLLAYGYGDGGGGVNRDMLEMQKAIKQTPGLPTVETTRADDYFNRLQETVEQTDQYVHTWDGELYLEYHRGTYTSQAEVKKKNRELELKLKHVEWYHTLKTIENKSFDTYPQADINQAWKILLRHQFHDIIPGTSIEEVYQDTREEYEQVEHLLDRALNHDSDYTQGAMAIYNDASYDRSSLVFLPNTKGDWISNGNSHVIESQQMADGQLLYVKNVPSMGYIKLNPVEKTNDESGSPFDYDNHVLTTPYYQLTFDEKGQIQELFDLEHRRDVIAPKESGNVLQVFEDKPVRYDAWDIDLYYQQKQYDVELSQPLTLEDMGPLQVTFSVSYRYNQSLIKQYIKLYKHSRRIDFETTVDWQEHQQLLKVSFPVNVRSTEATFDIQYGNVKRPTHWNTSWDHARFESVGHQWADLSEGNYGVALLNDCKYGYDIKEHTMRLSLIKSGIHPDPEADQGTHQFTYALMPHADDWYRGKVDQEAYDLNQPLHVKDHAFSDDASKRLFYLDHDRVVIDAVKKAEKEDAVIVRMHEKTGSHVMTQLLSDFAIEQWTEVDLMERPIQDDVMTGPINAMVHPYEIKTFKIWFTR
ncbi:alpha-mannosidase [Pelagirhabdus alkalitolerans]|uniref:Alpha-mannosidase n=1 Tax=Pelagirhabdus alkalitolerans TaxID=1612202 RepID=A0A1G6LGR4_9BACI|nr:alpha-mannosidase [Pelagirhabdus alkalitolerans]SDC42394.1 alpha-mannosidase [Pelagirhabdus alkalitolerans]